MPSHQPTDVTAEFHIDGEWADTYAGTDLTARVRGQDMIRITRGLQDQQSATSPVGCNFVLNNRDGLFTDDNPSSPLFGKLPLNTQIRLGIKSATGTWDEYFRMPDTLLDSPGDNYAYTADKATLDITSDIDIRVEIGTYYTRGVEQTMCGKWLSSGNQRSWLLTLNADGQIKLWTSPDGTFGAALSCSSGVVLLPEGADRQALRVTLDVNDGAGNRVYRFYTADTITGTWTLISSGTFAGTTSLFNSSQVLEVGSANAGGSGFVGVDPYRGKMYAFELWSGLGVTKVADFKPDGLGPETTTWVDTCATPNTWLFSGSYARLASDRIRVCAEATSLPDNWDVTGNDVWVPVTLAGIFQRYSSNKSAIGSAIYRMLRLQSGLKGYWPLEKSTYSPVPGAYAATGSQITFGSTTGLDGSEGAVTLTNAPNASELHLISAIGGPGTGTASFVYYFQLAALPATDQVFCTAYATSGATATEWRLSISANSYSFNCYDRDGTLVDSSGAVLFGTGASPLDQWVAMSLQLTTEGGNVRWQTVWHGVGSSTFYTHNPGGDTYAGSTGQFYALNFGTPDAAFAGAQVAHGRFSNTSAGDLISSDTLAVSTGWTGETALARMRRLALEEGFPFEWLGATESTPAMGPQSADTLFTNLSAAATVDGGILTESRDRLGGFYISRAYLGNRPPLEVSYTDSHLAAVPLPTRDNRYTVNDFTATSGTGGSARYEVTDPALKNVSDPPVGAGRWDRSSSFNIADDSQLPAMAQKQTALGAWPGRRVPNLAFGLHRSEIFSDATLMRRIIAQDCGDPAILVDLTGSPFPPDDLTMVTFGYTEQFNGFLWDIAANTVPLEPFRVPIIEDYASDSEVRLDAAGLTVVHRGTAGVGGATTAFIVRTPRLDDDGMPYSRLIDTAGYAAEFPVDIKIAGERLTLTAATAPVQTGALVSGGFEGGVAGWTSADGTLTQSSTFARTGTFSALLTVTGAPTISVAYLDLAFAPHVEVGDSITFSVFLRSVVLLADVRASIDWIDADGVTFSSSNSGAAALASGAFTQRTLTATAPAGTVYARYGWQIRSSPAAGTLLYADDAVFTNNSANYQTVTVTRGVNLGGTGKVLMDGDPLYLFKSFYLGEY